MHTPNRSRFLFGGLVFLLLTLTVEAETRHTEVNLGEWAQVEQLQNTLASVAEEVSPSVVAISSRHRIEPFSVANTEPAPYPSERHRSLRDQWMPAVGTGIIIRSDGLILTNEHVIHRADPENITCTLAGGEVYAVRSITSDPRSDLAVLRIDARDLEVVKLGDAGTVQQGHFAIVMGNPFGSATGARGKPAMSFGIISALGRPLTRQLDPHGDRYYGNLIQTDARINPGNSGGPLLNIKGEVIGIATAISTRSGGSDGVGFAIAMDRRIKGIIAQLARGEEVEYGFLGVQLNFPSPEDRRLAGTPDSRGALVSGVHPDTPAHAAGLQPGDIIAEFDGQPVTDYDHLIRLVGAARVGTEVPLVLYRRRERMTVKIMPVKRTTIPNRTSVR